MKKITEEEIIFIQLPQWNVSVNDKVIARVTERVVGQPRFSVTLILNADKEEVFFETAEEVVSYILGYVNG